MGPPSAGASHSRLLRAGEEPRRLDARAARASPAGILELLPWLKQWHNDIHPEYQERMGDFFQQFVEDEARAMEMTMDEIRGWTPPVQSRTRGRKKRNT